MAGSSVPVGVDTAAQVQRAAEAIIARRDHVVPQQGVLVAISGIDGSGKGYLAGRIVERLGQRSVRAVSLSVDGWLNLPARRFRAEAPAPHFYEHAIRFEEMFADLVLPLKMHRSVHLVADFTEETAREYRKHTYHFEDVDVIVLEGIFLLKREYCRLYDLTVWIECSFETARERALTRGQEGLSPAETVRAYETIYFPAQRIHFARDQPQAAADIVLLNDGRLTGR